MRKKHLNSEFDKVTVRKGDVRNIILERSKKYYMESIQNNSYGKKYEKKYLKYLFHFHFIKGKNSENG